MTIDVNKIRQDFPILHQKVNDEQLIYFDNAATSQTPLPVLDTIRNYYLQDNANVHRGVHTLAERATELYECGRQKVADFIGAQSPDEIIFNRSTTEGLNMVARGFGDQVVSAGDEIVISIMEHHSNLVPWQQLAQRTGAKLRYIGLDGHQQLNINIAREIIGPKTKIVAITGASNVLGILNPITTIAKLAHQNGAYLVVDGAQLVGHFPVNVEKMGADFLAFSGHKMLGPTGIGVLYGKKKLLKKMQPVQYGGEMIADVHQQTTTFKKTPLKFEAGTPNISGAIGLGAAVDYINKIGIENIQQLEQKLSDYLLPQLIDIDGITVYGPRNHHTGVIAFNIDGVHPHDVATGLDMEGIAVRAGHHCAQPLMKELGVVATVRLSLDFYNTKDECDQFIKAIKAVKEFFTNGIS